MVLQNIEKVILILKEKVEVEHNSATPISDDDDLYYLSESIIDEWEK